MFKTYIESSSDKDNMDKNLKQMIKTLNQLNWDDTDKALRDVRTIFRNYQSKAEDWFKYRKSNKEEGYSRNEVHTEPNKYSLVLMVWKPCMRNFIHDHCGSKGLVKILEGSLVEQHYTYNKNRKKGKRLTETDKITFSYNDVIDHKGFQDFHRMHNPDKNKEAVSLHLYAPPLETCTIIDKVTNVTETVQMKYASTQGRVNPSTEINPLYELIEDSTETKNSPISILGDLYQKLDKLNWNNAEEELKENITDLLKSQDADDCEWAGYCKIPLEEEYSRTTFVFHPHFTLCLSYYKPGAENMLHDHGEVQCISKVLEGEIEEALYEKNICNDEWEWSNTNRYKKNDIQASEGLHSNKNPSNKEPAITLNVFTSHEVKCRFIERDSKIPYGFRPTLQKPEGLRRRRGNSNSSQIPHLENVESLIEYPLKYSNQQDKKITVFPSSFRIAPICLSFLALILAFTALVVILDNDTGSLMRGEESPPTSPFVGFCFKCSLIGDYPDQHPKHNQLLEILNNLTRRKIDDHNSECCVENHDHFTVLLSFLMQSVNAKKAVNQNDVPYATPVSAHKLLLPEHNSTDRREHFPLTLNSLSHNPSIELVRGVDITKDGFIIKYTGLYYVYSSVKLMRANPAHKTLYHYLHRISPNNPMQTGVLLRSVHTPCQDCVQSQDTSFTGGVFFLQSGDNIQVCVSERGVVESQRGDMYMGLIMLKS